MHSVVCSDYLDDSDSDNLNNSDNDNGDENKKKINKK